MSRFRSLSEFWPHYLSEHREPRSRALHFVGTSLFFGALGGSFVLNPVFFPPAFLGVVGLGAVGNKLESTRGGHLPMLGMIGLATAASPVLIPAGVVGAYACAWVGHFRIENNRPATFQYPLWSLLCDLRMWSHMARGRLWKGDPLDELGLDAPAASTDEEEPAAA